MDETKAQLKSLAEFVLDILDEWPEVGDLDGYDLQEIASKHGLLVPEIKHKPCGDSCYCSGEVDNEDWEKGVTCYRIADFVTRAAEQRDEPDAQGQTCPVCKGHGRDPMSDIVNWLPCAQCHGTGQV